MTRALRVSCVQHCAGTNLDRNLRQLEKLISRAATDGAEVVCLPEYATCYGASRGKLQVGAEDEERHPALIALRDMARQKSVWLQVGSLAIRHDDDLINNRSYLISAEGVVVASYDKVHLFDVNLDGGESYRESAVIKAGDKAVLAKTPLGNFGLTICYDIRFPQLYRTLAKAGADVIFAPAAFTRKTGRDHWHTLVTARAIETGSFLVAPCQCGDFRGRLQRYGHSLIIGPWGEILADGGEDAGVISADLDLDKVAAARSKIPALRHDRLFEITILSNSGDEAEPSSSQPNAS